MSARDRAWFVQELIAALQEQGELVPGAALGPSAADSAQPASEPPLDAQRAPAAQFTGLFSRAEPPRQAPELAAAAYDKLQFDFPQVDEHEVKALAEVYRSFASSAVSDGGSVADFALTRTLVEGIAFLNERNDGGARSSEASGMLAASVLLELVRFCVDKRGSPKVRALLGKLSVPLPARRADPAGQYSDQDQTRALTALAEESDAYAEKYAAQEDPDDLGEVYEGGEPTDLFLRRQASPLTPQQPTVPTALPTRGGVGEGAEFDKKLRFLASRTFSSTLAALSVEKWLEWRLDDGICALIRLLVESEGDEAKGPDTPFFGAAGEWTRYLYILRDRLLRFPASSQHGIRSLKGLVQHFQASREPRYSSLQSTSLEGASDQQQPHRVVYRVLAELVVSKEFQQRSSQRAQESLAAAIYDLLPLIVEELQLVSRSLSSQGPATESAAAWDSDLVVIFLQLLHFLMLTAGSVRVMAQSLHESGVLRTLLTLLSDAAASSTQADGKEGLVDGAWFRPLIRLIGECALWHEGVAQYVARVPKAAALLPRLPAMFPAEAVVLSFAFHQHRVDAPLGVWELFASPALFPPRCESFLDAMEKLQDAVFVLDALVAAIPSMRAPIQAELRQHAQKMYAAVFPGAFEYPQFAAGADQSAPVDVVDAEEDRTHKADRGRSEARRFEVLRNKLRQTAKALLLALAPGRGGEPGRSMASKLD